MRSNGLLSKFDTFVFDWDGTLSSMKLLRAVNERLNPHWKYKKIATISTKRIDAGAVARSKQRELRLFAPFFDVSLVLMKPKLHNDSREVLASLRENRKKVALLTNGAAYRVKREIGYLGITKYFDIIVSCQELNALKPNPIGLELIMRKTRSRKDRVLYIGDMADDIALAKFAKVRSCAISAGLDSYGKLKASRPDYIFTSMEEFRRAL
jgi:HAD superfamily hydrolase (TIGR01509 family)